jgi:tetratricopeptide (TPR) repeat protein
MPPSMVFPTGQGEPVAYLNASSYLTARIIRENDWKQPIHFAVTVAPQTLIGLENYMKTQGMVFLLTRDRHEDGYGFDIPSLERNLFGKYRYTGVTDSSVYKDNETSKLLRNYFVSYVDLCRAYLETGDRDNAARTARAAIELTLSDLDRRIILYRILDRNGLSVEAARMVDEELARYSMDDAEHMIDIGTRFIEYEMSSGAVTLFTRLTERHPHNLLAWKALSASYYQAGQTDEASRALNRVLELAPRDREALELRRILDENTGNR